MDLIKINLLPYREMREAKQKQQFQVIMMIGGLIGVAVAGAIYMYLSQAIETQESRNASLQTGMTELENQLKTIDEL
ncbi:PilN domain-containing protein, partial [Simonsiella muelleri]|uniref:PilN domain-containing protein n=1 Tax=Simonsiella muelleri TaxID=72 RepID=UPI003C6FDA46